MNEPAVCSNALTFVYMCRCANVVREKLHKGDLQMVQVAVSNEKTLTITYPPTEREILQMSLRNIEARPANHEDGADY